MAAATLGGVSGGSSETPPTRIGIDVGGTFTDLVALDADSGVVRSRKVLTTADAPARGVLAGLAALAGEAPGSAIAAIAHGTTIVTNAVVEGKGARTAVVTTRGFRDVLEIARQSRLVTRGGTPRPVKSKETVGLEAGDVVTIETGGGGGYGDPAAGPAALAAADRQEGYVS